MQVKLVTSVGDIEITLDKEKAPITVENFVKYVKDGFYDGTIFHRVINSFMIQGGGFDSDMQQKATSYPEIKNEAKNGLANDKYTIAMARTMAPHSASSQFFINVADNDFLNFSSETPQGWGYAVFGKVTKGSEVVEKIKAVATKKHGMHSDVPVESVVIKSATLITQ